MASLDRATIENMLKSVIDPNVATDLVSAKAVKHIAIDGSTVSVGIELGYPRKAICPN